ncbi:hypothetical protein [Yinghuangia seranimata]|uniref:hypothetical protein n=1 Tax=Yinghuangia seranimata TaxID=408067 RepID=UPI00248D2880|nr:hypothetical protein [Yinghuangia seranimata]MDI2130476.1 hypothetical protein [Yinghuangia seranimata]
MTATNPVVGPDGHVDVDVLSDLTEDLLDDARAAEARAHLAACAECRETYEALAEVAALLRGQPDEPMPDDVFARIEAALAEAAAEDAGPEAPLATVTPLPSAPSVPRQQSGPPPRPSVAPVVPLAHPERLEPVRPHRPRRRAGLLLAAAAVAAMAVGVGVIARNGVGSSNDKTASKPAAGADRSAVRTEGGAGAAGVPPAAPQATPKSLAPDGTFAVPPAPTGPAASPRALERAGVPDRVRALAAPGQSLTSGSTSFGSGAPATSGSPTAAAMAGQLPQCVTSAADASATPTAAERVRFEGRTAYLLVYAPPGSTSANAVVVADGCSGVLAKAQPSDVLLRISVPLP